MMVAQYHMQLKIKKGNFEQQWDGSGSDYHERDVTGLFFSKFGLAAERDGSENPLFNFMSSNCPTDPGELATKQRQCYYSIGT